MNKDLYSFTGASGTGKSTLLNILSEDFNMCTIELSGRPYLPTTGDYVTNKSDSINRRISYGSLVTFTEALFKYPRHKIFFSRCAIDRLAYGRTLGVGEDLHDIIIKEIQEIVIPYVKVFYLPIEFDLPNNDEVRGNNEEIRKLTDENVKKILIDMKIPYITVSGNIAKRTETIIKNL